MASGLKVGSFLLLSLALAAGSVLIGEVVLVLAYIVLPIAVITRWPNRKAVGWTAACIFGMALILHLMGFKFLGSATVAELESLRHSRRIVSLEPPNIIRFTDGSMGFISNIFFPAAVYATNQEASHYTSLRGFANRKVLVEQNSQPLVGISVELAKATNGSSGVVCLRKQSYWCGNTWHPQFFPRRLPRQKRVDLAPLLVASGLAFPTPEYASLEPRRNDELILALEDMIVPELPQQHPEVERLGLTLLGRQQWGKGLDLLIGIGASNAIAGARERIRGELNKSLANGIADAATSNLWISLFLKVDPDAAEQALARKALAPDLDIDRVSSLAGAMVDLWDLRGFDLLVTRLGESDPSSELSRRLSQHLQSWFRFDIYLNGGGWPDDIGPEFLDWYRAIRLRLSYERLSTGRQGFSLDGNIPFDSNYYDSMKPFKDRIAKRHGRAIHQYRFYD